MPILKQTEYAVSRRTFLAQSGLALTGIALAGSAHAVQAAPATITLGSGLHSYHLLENWGMLPPSVSIGIGTGIAVDSHDNVYITGFGGSGIIVLNREGYLVRNITGAFTEAAHAVCVSRDNGDEFLCVTQPDRNLVTKTTLDGRAVMQIGKSSGAIYEQLNQPTAAAVSPNGDVFICEGYGGQRLLRYDRHGRYIHHIGTLGDRNGCFNICHGITINSRSKDTELYISDRENSRIEVFTADLIYKRSIDQGINLPAACVIKHDLLFVVDQRNGINIFDSNDQFVMHMENSVKPMDHNITNAFSMPHDAAIDSKGDLYTIDWVEGGRVRKFMHYRATS